MTYFPPDRNPSLREPTPLRCVTALRIALCRQIGHVSESQRVRLKKCKAHFCPPIRPPF